MKTYSENLKHELTENKKKGNCTVQPGSTKETISV